VAVGRYKNLFPVALLCFAAVSCAAGKDAAVMTRGGPSSPSTTSTTSTTTSTTIAETTTTTAVDTTTTAAKSTSTTNAPSPPAALNCHDSVDPACGPLVWNPPLVNHPLTITITADKQVVAFGESVTLTATIADEDAPPHAECAIWGVWSEHQMLNRNSNRAIVRIGDPGNKCEEYDGYYWSTCAPAPIRHGEWTPPAPNGGVASSTLTVTNNGQDFAAGLLDFTARSFSGPGKCNYGVENPRKDGIYADLSENYLHITFLAS
jgi:hypothetical protein